MNIETVRERKESLLREIERDQFELKNAFRDLRTSVSVSEKVKTSPKGWVLGALIAGFLVGELT